MTRRKLLTFLFWAAATSVEASENSVRGILTRTQGDAPALKTPDGKLILLEGDPPTMAVVRDRRLAGATLEVMGTLGAPDRFIIGPIHKKSMWVHKSGKKLMITYWCDVCSIRTYSPGKCWCCQEETELDLREPDEL